MVLYFTSFAEEIRRYEHYVDNFEKILNLIYEKDLEETRKKYRGIYFAQIGVWEKAFLYYTLNLREKGYPAKWDEYKFELFEIVPVDLFQNTNHLSVLEGINPDKPNKFPPTPPSFKFTGLR